MSSRHQRYLRHSRDKARADAAFECADRKYIHIMYKSHPRRDSNALKFLKQNVDESAKFTGGVVGSGHRSIFVDTDMSPNEIKRLLEARLNLPDLKVVRSVVTVRHS